MSGIPPLPSLSGLNAPQPISLHPLSIPPPPGLNAPQPISIPSLGMLFHGKEFQDHPLFQAVARGDLQVVTKQLPSFPWKSNQPLLKAALSGAASKGHTAVFQLLLDHGAKMSDGELFEPAWRGHLEIARIILDRGNAVHDLIASPLCAAAGWGHSEMVELLLSHPNYVLVNEGDERELEMAFRHAAGGGHLELLGLLWEKGAHDVDGALTELMEEHPSEVKREVVVFMLEHGATNHECVLQFATLHGDIGLVSEMLHHVAEDDYSLIAAVLGGNLGIIGMLLDHNIGKPNEALIRAIEELEYQEQPDLSIVRLLLDHVHGADNLSEAMGLAIQLDLGPEVIELFMPHHTVVH